MIYSINFVVTSIQHNTPGMPTVNKDIGAPSRILDLSVRKGAGQFRSLKKDNKFSDREDLNLVKC